MQFVRNTFSFNIHLPVKTHFWEFCGAAQEGKVKQMTVLAWIFQSQFLSKFHFSVLCQQNTKSPPGATHAKCFCWCVSGTMCWCQTPAPHLVFDCNWLFLDTKINWKQQMTKGRGWWQWQWMKCSCLLTDFFCSVIAVIFCLCCAVIAFSICAMWCCCSNKIDIGNDTMAFGCHCFSENICNIIVNWLQHMSFLLLVLLFCLLLTLWTTVVAVVAMDAGGLVNQDCGMPIEIQLTCSICSMNFNIKKVLLRNS